MTPPHTYHPDFDCECWRCGTSPCVVVSWHIVPNTELCGPHFFHDPTMVDFELWNDQVEPSEETTND